MMRAATRFSQREPCGTIASKPGTACGWVITAKPPGGATAGM